RSTTGWAARPAEWAAGAHHRAPPGAPPCAPANTPPASADDRDAVEALRVVDGEILALGIPEEHLVEVHARGDGIAVLVGPIPRHAVPADPQAARFEERGVTEQIEFADEPAADGVDPDAEVVHERGV